MSGSSHSGRHPVQNGDLSHPDSTTVAGRPEQTHHDPLVRTQEALDATHYKKLSPAHSFEMDDSAVLMPDDAAGQMRRRSQSQAGSLFGSGILRTDGTWLQRGSGIMFFKGFAKHTLGLCLLGCVVFLWTLSNFLGSSIFADSSYAKPFFLTYLSTTTFTVVMIPSFLKGVLSRYKAGTLRSEFSDVFSLRTLSFLLRGPSTLTSNSGHYSSILDDNEESETFLEPNTLIDSQGKTRSGSSILHSPSSTSAANPFKHDETERRSSVSSNTTEHLPLLPTARLALAFALLWFSANYFAMACLQHTTVASTTILASTASVWTLLIGVATKTERFTWGKLCGVVGSLIGIALISSADFAFAPSEAPTDDRRRERGLMKRAIDEFPDKPSTELALGDAMALLSAIIYGAYTITLKRSTLSASPQVLHMPTFFGLVGFFNMIILLPGFPLLHMLDIEPFAFPPTFHIWAVLLLNSVSSLLSDLLWAYAMMFTGPLVVTVGLSLTIPLSLIGEMLIQGRYEGWIYWVGAGIVVGSFVFVEREEVNENEDADEDVTGGSGNGLSGRTRFEKNGSRKRILADVDADVERGVVSSSAVVGASADTSKGSTHRNSSVSANAATDLVDLLSDSEDQDEDEDDQRRDYFQRLVDGSDPYSD